jgi:hypothetical protein
MLFNVIVSLFIQLTFYYVLEHFVTNKNIYFFAGNMCAIITIYIFQILRSNYGN